LNPNIQTYVLLVCNPQGHVWPVGTNTKRGFTKAGAEKAQAKAEAALPHGWDVWEHELVPLDELLAFGRRNVV
jgi:hypothetical protein